MRGHEDRMEQLGARLVFVGSGTPAMAADFKERFSVVPPVLVDTSRQAFAAAAMRRSLFSTLHWRSLRSAIRAYRAGFRQGRVLGDPWQQGGVLVFDGVGEIRHKQSDQVGGDPLDVEAILAVL